MPQPKVAALTDQTAKLAGDVIVIDVPPMFHFVECSTAEGTLCLRLQQVQNFGRVNSQAQHADASTIDLCLVLLRVFALPSTRSDLAQVSWDRSVVCLGVLSFTLATMRTWFGIRTRSDSESRETQPAFTQRACTSFSNGETAIPTEFRDGAFRTFALWTNIIGMVHHMDYIIGPVCAGSSIGPVCADGGF